MKKESTYQRYKRENELLRSITAVEIREFLLFVDYKEAKRRIEFIRKQLETYRIS